MKTIQVSILLLIIVVVLSFTSVAQSQLQIQNLLNKEQMESAGLHKLTSAELATLNHYLTLIVKVALEDTGTSNYDNYSSEAPPVTSKVIESRISAEFTGWDGETIFKLMNGQIWQQASYAYHYHYAYMPYVTIYQVGSRYKMKVDGVSGTIFVKRIR